MKFVNRGYMIVHPKEAFITWANENDADYSNLEDNEPNVYLIQEDFFDEDLIKRVEDAGNSKEDPNKKEKKKATKKDNKAARNLPLEKINKMQKSIPKHDKALKPKTLKKQI